MKKFVFTLALFLSSVSYAQVAVKTQTLRLLAIGQNIGSFTMEAPAEKGSDILVHNFSSGTIRYPTGHLAKYSSDAKHIFDKNWKWKSSEMYAKPVSDLPGLITVSPNKVIVNAVIGKKRTTKNYDYTGMVMPRRAFYTYLRTLSTPPPKMQPQEIYLMSEMNLMVYKITWMYLGSEKRGKSTLHKYETRGELNTVITIDDKANLVSAKEMDLRLEIAK